MSLRFVGLVAPAALSLLLVACASRKPAETRSTSAATRAVSLTGIESTELASRVLRAKASREAIERAIALEDGPRKGKAKSLPVGHQVHVERETAAKLVPTSPYVDAAVGSYEEACAKLEASYLGSLLESTDPSSQPGGWAIDEGRDVLGSPSVDAKLAAWQAKDPARSLAKFAVVRAADGVSLEVHVGSLDVGHVDIAGAPALSAGLLRTSVVDGKTTVIAFENTSGGFRPGPLRNRTTLAAIKAAGYLPTSSSALTIHDNPSGSYADSKLMPR